MKRPLLLVITSLMILTACGNGNDENSRSNNRRQEQNSNNVKTITTDQEVQGDNYRTILPFKEGQARGVLQDSVADSYNGEGFESGLLHLSESVFPTDNFLHQDRQYLNKNTVNAYLGPKYSKDEIDHTSESEKESKKATENLGLNLPHDGETKSERIAESSPAYLSNILEQNFHDTNDTRGKEIKDVTIGPAMNSVYHYQKEKDGETYGRPLDNREVEKQGKVMARELLTRPRANKDLKNIPIHFAVYVQSNQDAITLGHFITSMIIDDKQIKINEWSRIDEISALLSSAEAEKYDRNLNSNFKQFNGDLQSYFSDFTQAVGKMKFMDKKPNRLMIDLPADYYGQAGIIGITRYVTGQVKKYFDNIDSYEVRVKDGNNSRSLISGAKDDKDPQVHIYSN